MRLMQPLKLLAIALSLLVFPVSAAIEAYQFQSDEQEALFRELAAELRCPKCQNQNIADSDAALAQDLRAKVYEMVSEGQDKQAVVDYMVARYGHFVHYQPPSSAASVIIAGPILLILIAGFVVVWRVRAGRKLSQRSEIQIDDERVQKLLGEAIPSASSSTPAAADSPNTSANKEK
ncbi:cytochrome c-type biogenesis protein CcmH [Corallincola luteus]|uniref:Cytochrome c-type biogenesis protein n=1 Tax=Corallincola luteus TaxID=1775177 RepID=A0ABY2ARN7_9GAMM|nr:cytochrome c-type biogenesis protein [Corallincola luteus]TCI05664.1 cytochrome c-type biogenesis protein CcmH [Corallincola luteus]